VGKSIWVNERLREELDYCVPLGIPHSKFEAWSEDDREKALAYRREMAKICSGCGTRHEEWDEDPDAYIGWITRCEGCKRVAQEKRNITEKDSDHVRVGLMPREAGLALMEQGLGT